MGRSTGSRQRTSTRVLTIVAAAGVALGAVGCTDDDAQTTDEPTIEREIEPARGAADGVVTQSEDGQDLDENLNVPGTETDAEVDD